MPASGDPNKTEGTGARVALEVRKFSWPAWWLIGAIAVLGFLTFQWLH